jgi:hypothetical protein
MKMNRKIKIMWTIIGVILVGSFISGCRSSERVAYNLDYQAEEFKLFRRIAAINGFTDKPLFEIIGRCSIETGSSYVEGAMEITCKTGEDSFSKHFVYLSDNVLIVVEQLKDIDVPQYHFQIVFAPQSLLPIPQIVGGNLGE